MNNNLPYLGKWPAMVVIGKKITENQAKEIIIRTSGLFFVSNNHVFVQALYEHIFKRKSQQQKYHSTICDYYTTEKEYRSVMEKYGILYDIEYLKNGGRVVSSYIGGPHGWCNWDGTIFTNSYNIGKYPSVDRVEKEWKIIARAFPYLNLKCQLWKEESTDPDNIPVIQYNIKNGKVTVVEPEDLYVYPGSGDLCRFFIGLKSGRSDFEAGCRLEDAIAALDYVEEMMSKCRK